MPVLELSRPPEMTPIPAPDRRRDPRRPAPTTTAKLYAPAGQKHLCGKTVTVTDLSLRGIGFTTDEPLVIGHLYGLEIQGNWMNLSSRIRIVSCRAGEVGAEFC